MVGIIDIYIYIIYWLGSLFFELSFGIIEMLGSWYYYYYKGLCFLKCECFVYCFFVGNDVNVKDDNDYICVYVVVCSG